jgi:hypothetical protein
MSIVHQPNKRNKEDKIIGNKNILKNIKAVV